MPDKDEYRSGKEIGELTGEVKLLTTAIGSLTQEFRDFKQGIGPRLENHDKDISALEAHRVNSTEFIGAVNKKVDHHVESHWKWIAILVGLMTLLGLLLKGISRI